MKVIAVAAVAAVLVGTSVRGLRSAEVYVHSSAQSTNAELVRLLPLAVRELGGPTRVSACGPVAAAALQNPAVAWAARVSLGDVSIFPGPSGTLFQTGGQPIIPAQYSDRYHLVGTIRSGHASWTLYTTCPVR